MIALLVLLISASAVPSSAEGNVTCTGTGLDWYKSQVGETPCKTYERLRQICNADFEVGTMSISTPPDFCDEQVADCCCNSVAFSLAMLCLNCQQNVGTGSGYDAGDGAYQSYLKGSRTSGTCTPVKNQTLPAAIQTAVCNQKIKIYDDLYSLFWGSGAWFYTYAYQTITKDTAINNNNTFTHCASTTVNGSSSLSSSSRQTSTSASSSPTRTSSSDSSSSSSSMDGGAIAGIAVGVATAVIGTALALWFLCWRRRKQQQEASAKPENNIEPFTTEAFGQPGGPTSILHSPYHYSALSQGAPVSTLSGTHHTDPSGFTSGYPNGTTTGYTSTEYPSTAPISTYGGSSSGPRSHYGSNYASSQAEAGSALDSKGTRLYSNQTPAATATTASITSPEAPGAPVVSPFDEEPHRDGGPVPEELLDSRPPPAYGEQLN